MSPLQLIVDKWCKGLDASVDSISYLIETSDDDDTEKHSALGDIIGELQRQAGFLSGEYGISVLLVEGDDDVEH